MDDLILLLFIACFIGYVMSRRSSNTSDSFSSKHPAVASTKRTLTSALTSDAASSALAPAGDGTSPSEGVIHHKKAKLLKKKKKPKKTKTKFTKKKLDPLHDEDNHDNEDGEEVIHDLVVDDDNAQGEGDVEEEEGSASDDGVWREEAWDGRSEDDDESSSESDWWSDGAGAGLDECSSCEENEVPPSMRRERHERRKERRRRRKASRFARCTCPDCVGGEDVGSRAAVAQDGEYVTQYPHFSSSGKPSSLRLVLKNDAVYDAVWRIAELVVRDFVEWWFEPYVSTDREFPDDVREVLDHVFAELATRATHVDWTYFFSAIVLTETKNLLRLMRKTERRLRKEHRVRVAAKRKSTRKPSQSTDTGDEEGTQAGADAVDHDLLSFDKLPLMERIQLIEERILETHKLHEAATGDTIPHLRKVAGRMVRFLLPRDVLSCKGTRSLTREVLAGNVLYPTMGFCDAYYVNYGIVAAMGYMEVEAEAGGEADAGAGADVHKEVEEAEEEADGEATLLSSVHGDVDETELPSHVFDELPPPPVLSASSAPAGTSVLVGESASDTASPPAPASPARGPHPPDTPPPPRPRAKTAAAARRNEWKISIKRAQTAFDPRPFVQYVMRVRNGDYAWVVRKRYSEFVKFNRALKSRFSKDHIDAKLPGKQLFGNLSEEFIQTRRAQLEEYMQQLMLSRSVIDSEELRLFLIPDPGDEVENVAKKAVPASTNSSSEDEEEDDDDEDSEALKKQKKKKKEVIVKYNSADFLRLGETNTTAPEAAAAKLDIIEDYAAPAQVADEGVPEPQQEEDDDAADENGEGDDGGFSLNPFASSAGKKKKDETGGFFSLTDTLLSKVPGLRNLIKPSGDEHGDEAKEALHARVRDRMVTKPVYDLIDELFSLNERGWIRRQVNWVVKQVVELALDSQVNQFLSKQVSSFTSQASMVSLLDYIRLCVWPADVLFTPQPLPTEEQKRQMSEEARRCLLEHLDLGPLKHVMGQRVCENGIERLYMLVQMNSLVRHLCHSSLDELVDALRRADGLRSGRARRHRHKSGGAAQ